MMLGWPFSRPSMEKIVGFFGRGKFAKVEQTRGSKAMERVSVAWQTRVRKERKVDERGKYERRGGETFTLLVPSNSKRLSSQIRSW